MTPRFFGTVADLRAWFETHGGSATELWIAYPKRGSGRAGVSYGEAVLEALCFGWIDGQVRRIDEHSYANRFTPRRPGSAWSLLNVRRARTLTREGRMRPAGRTAFAARTRARTGVYSFERGDPPRSRFDPASRRRLNADSAARAHFEAQPPGYRRTVTEWVMTAKRPETRARRIAAVIASSRAGRRVNPVRPFADLRSY